MKNINFVCGLPRSGSTLLQNILAQNPKFHATHTSGCLDTLFAIRNNWSTLIEHKAHPCPNKLKNVLKGAFQAYYEDINEPVIFDKSRGWFAYVEFIEELLDSKMKILVTMRPIPEILASFEVLYRETSKVKQPPGEAQNYFQFQTIAGRCAYWMQNEQVVGLTLNRLEDAIARKFQDRMHFVDFNLLTTYPEKTMKSIYEFIGEEYYNHDFDNVKQTTQEDDEIHGFVNLHKIRNKVQPVKSKAVEVLGKDIVDFYTKK